MPSSYARRDFLRHLSLASAAATGSAFTPGLLAQSRNANPLKMPALLRGDLQAGTRHYNLAMQSGQTQFFPGLNTATYGLNGSYLGPTLKLQNGEQVAMHVRNGLNEVTTLHWHGLHVPARADGGPHQTIQPGSTWDADFSVMQRGGTFWYHSHTMGKTGEQVYRGLAGMIQLEDEDTVQDGLPSEYGVDDIPVIIQDKRFNRDGSLAYIGMHRDVMAGFTGNTLLVNGTLNAYFDAATDKLRLRLLNASNSRIYTLAFSDDRPFSIIGCGGSLLQTPLTQRQLILAPAERADIVVDLSDGRPTMLTNIPMPANSPFQTQGMMRNMLGNNDQPFDILELRPQSGAASSPALPGQLTTITPMQESSAVRTRRFVLNMMMGMGMMGGGGPGGRGPGGGGGGMNMNTPFSINGASMDMNVINERITMGDTEIWEIVNDTMMTHPFHVHHSQFQILDRNGRPPAAEERGYKDTVKVGPGETVRFIMRFENFSDAERAYMYHCHILEHEDNGMMGQFLVV